MSQENPSVQFPPCFHVRSLRNQPQVSADLTSQKSLRFKQPSILITPTQRYAKCLSKPGCIAFKTNRHWGLHRQRLNVVVKLLPDKHFDFGKWSEVSIPNSNICVPPRASLRLSRQRIQISSKTQRHHDGRSALAVPESHSGCSQCPISGIYLGFLIAT